MGLAAGMPGKFALASAWKTVATVLCIASDHDTGAVVPALTSSIRAKVQAWNYVLGAPQINEIPIVSTLGKILVKEVVLYPIIHCVRFYPSHERFLKPPTAFTRLSSLNFVP